MIYFHKIKVLFNSDRAAWGKAAWILKEQALYDFATVKNKKQDIGHVKPYLAPYAHVQNCSPHIGWAPVMEYWKNVQYTFLSSYKSYISIPIIYGRIL